MKPYEPLVEEYKSNSSSSSSGNSLSFQTIHPQKLQRICCVFLIIHVACLTISIFALVYAVGGQKMHKEEDLILSKTAPLNSRIKNLGTEMNSSLLTVELLQRLPNTIELQLAATLIQSQESSNNTLRAFKETLHQQQQMYDASVDAVRQQFESQLETLNTTLQKILSQDKSDRTLLIATFSDLRQQVYARHRAVEALEQMSQAHQIEASSRAHQQERLLNHSEENVGNQFQALRRNLFILHPNETSLIAHNSSSKFP